MMQHTMCDAADTGGRHVSTGSAMRLIGLAMTLTQVALPQALQFQWARQFGSPTRGVEDRATAAAAGGGAYYIAGTVMGALPGQPFAGARDAFLRKYDASGAILWTRQFGGTFGNEWVYGVAVDSNGNAYVAGSLDGTLSGQISSGSMDAFLVKYDANGNHVWSRQFGTNMPDEALAVGVDAAGNAVVAGYTQGAFLGFTNQGGEDVFVRKFDPSGNAVLTDQFGTTGSDRGWAAGIDGSGNAVVGGLVSGALPALTHQGNYDAWLRKYNSAGAVAWTTQFGTGGYDWITGLSIDSSGSIYTSLYWGSNGMLRKYDPAGAMVWSTPTLGIAALAVSADATGVALAGSISGAAPDQRNAIVYLYDANGAFQWSYIFGSDQFDEALGVAISPSAFLVAGDTYGALPGQASSGLADAFARVFARTGNTLWTNQFGATDSAWNSAFAVHASGGVYTAGHAEGPLPGQTHSGSEDAYVIKHDSSGSVVWTRQFGTDGRDTAYAVTADPAGNVFVGGRTNGTLPGQTRTGWYDAFVRKYDSSGNELWTRQFGATVWSEVHLVAAVTDSAGNVYVTGYTNGALPGQTLSGAADVYVRKYDAAGNEVWTRQFGTNTYDQALALAVDSAGGILVAGYTAGTFPGQTKSGNYDAFLARLGASGNLVSVTQFGSGAGSYTSVARLAFAADGSIYMGGFVSGGALPGQVLSGASDAFVRKLDSGGNELWTRQFGSAGSEEAKGLAVDGTGNVTVIGYTSLALPGQVSAGSQDIFLRTYSPAGVELATLQYGNPGADNVTAGSADASGAIYVSGYTNGQYAGQPKTGYFDSFAVKFQANLNAAPAISANQPSLTVPEGSTAANSGAFSDADVADNVTLSASLGTVTKSGTNAGTWAWSWNAADGPAGPHTVTITANDGKGGSAAVSFTVTVDNVAPTVSFSVTPSLNENQTATLSGTIADPGALDTHAVTIDWGDGSTSTLALASGVLSFTASHTYADDDPSGTSSDVYTVTVGVTDKDGGAGAAGATLAVNNLPPSIGTAAGPLDPLALGSSAAVSVPVSDPGPQDTLTCTFVWDDGKPHTTAPASFGSCSATHVYGAAGVYTVAITVTDDDTGTAATRYEYVVVYDPSAGFVTGGGWIQSLPGAYVADPSLTGKASFGFVSKYENGASSPTGQTEFQFHTAKFRFNSTVYDWLVIAGARAQYKGSGSVNGEGGYGFLLTAVDGQVNGGGGVDKFRIKIWKKATDSSPETLVYDNVLGGSDDIDAANPQALGGGSIAIHKK